MEERSEFTDYYQLLGVSTEAEPQEIKRGFQNLAMKHHPDVGGSTETMQQLTAAYRTLMSATGRKAYDLQHDFHIGRSKVHYRTAGSHDPMKSIDDLSDEEIDDFMDELYAEYAYRKKPKQSLLTKLKSFF